MLVVLDLIMGEHVLCRKRLSKLAFKRVREARTAFRTYSAKLPHETRIKYERKYASQGLFDFKSQTAQVISSSGVSTDSNLLMLFLSIPSLGVCTLWSVVRLYSCWPYFY